MFYFGPGIKPRMLRSSEVLQAYSAKKRDKLLVETNIFAILGVSFCATQMEATTPSILKKENVRSKFSKSSMPLFFTQIRSCIKVSILENMARQYLLFNITYVLGYYNEFTFFRRQFFAN